MKKKLVAEIVLKNIVNYQSIKIKTKYFRTYIENWI